MTSPPSSTLNDDSTTHLQADALRECVAKRPREPQGAGAQVTLAAAEPPAPLKRMRTLDDDAIPGIWSEELAPYVYGAVEELLFNSSTPTPQSSSSSSSSFSSSSSSAPSSAPPPLRPSPRFAPIELHESTHRLTTTLSRISVALTQNAFFDASPKSTRSPDDDGNASIAAPAAPAPVLDAIPLQAAGPTPSAFHFPFAEQFWASVQDHLDAFPVPLTLEQAAMVISALVGPRVDLMRDFGCVVFDREWNCTFANPMASWIVGASSPAELLSMRNHALIQPGGYRRLLKAMENHKRGVEVNCNILPVRKLNGDEISIISFGFGLFDEDKELVGQRACVIPIWSGQKTKTDSQ